ncbi:MAG: helix-hairpin-helix domain-containing protein [Bdellovibrionota bacterium]
MILSKSIDKRRLIDLISVGKATIKDLELLGITKVHQLKSKDPQKLYDELCEITGSQHDICCLDVFKAAVEQAKDPDLSRDKCNWWYWSKQRK